MATVVESAQVAPAAGTTGTFALKKGLAQMLKGGVIMDVVNVEQAKIAEAAGACAVMALERVPADIRAQGGVARMSDPALIVEIKRAVSIPVMAKARIGHFVEAQVLEAIGIDFIDESEVLTPADDQYHIAKHKFKVCGSVWSSTQIAVGKTDTDLHRKHTHTPHGRSRLCVVHATSARRCGGSAKGRQ